LLSLDSAGTIQQVSSWLDTFLLQYSHSPRRRAWQRMAEAMKSCTVTYEHDDTGWWVATVKEIRGCHTQGRTIDQARRRIREALGLFINNSETVEIIDDVKLPRDLRLLLTQIEMTRKHADEATNKLNRSRKAAAKALTKDLGVSVRDAGLLLGLSHQRIHQLLKSS
jgi:predicted RNase H-like HicB family nuclease